MATRNTEPQDLGRLEEIDVSRLGAVLWRRFGVIETLDTLASELILAVEDLDRRMGDPPRHRLELHLLGTFENPQGFGRLRRALSIVSPVLPRIYAFGETRSKLVVICEPVGGVVGGAELERTKLLKLAIELVELMIKFHAAGVRGIEFSRSQLRFEEGRCMLYGATHLLGASRSSEADFESLRSLLSELGSDAHVPSNSAVPTTPQEFLQQLRALNPSEFVLPTDPPFVGREDVLRSLEGGLAQAQIAKPTMMVVQGVRGVGKSRLLSQFVHTHVHTNDALVLTGLWHDGSADTRGAILGALEHLSRVLPTLDPDERDDIRMRINQATKRLGAILVRSAPTLGTVLRHAEELPQLELASDFSRHTAVIADVLKSIGTRKRPLVLVLDNLENIDANSSAILDIIGQSRPAHHTLVVMGMRQDVRGTALPLSIETERLKLAALSIDEVHHLLTQWLPGTIEEGLAIAKVLHRISDGLPLAIGANVRAWLDTGRLTRSGDETWQGHRLLREEFDGSEFDVRKLFRERILNSDEAVRDLALRIAVFGVEISIEDIRGLYVDIDTDVDISTTLAQLLDRGLLTSNDDGAIRFPHDAIRESVLESSNDAERRDAHRRVAALLTKRGAPIAQIVFHRDLGFDIDNETPEGFDKLSRLHVEAGRDRLDVYDLERARWHLERALEHSHDPEQRGLAAEGLADVCLLQDDLETAVSLYTALIATANPVTAIRIGAKAVQFLFSKSASADARQLGLMALEMAHEPTPLSPIGKLSVLLRSLFHIWLGPPKTIETTMREALCGLYPYMMFVALIDDPVGAMAYAARSSWIAMGLRTGSAAIVFSLQGALLAVLGRVSASDRVFANAIDIASHSNDAWAEGNVFQNWGVTLLSLDRYAEGQDRLDDAIAAFRETGDVSISLLSMMSKGIYGRDREHAETILGWLNEALTTARRNGKRIGVAPIRALKLHVLARRGQTDLQEQLDELAQVIETEEMPGLERLTSRIHLVYACLECSSWSLGLTQVRRALEHFREMGGGVPEVCQEVHLVAALFLLAFPGATRADRKLLRRSARKFRSATKRLPRLWVLGDLLDLKLALAEKKTAKAQGSATKIVNNFEIHENLHAARQAHRVLARLHKGDNVLAASEHERIARNLGRRLGLADHVLLSDFSEMGEEFEILTFGDETAVRLDESQQDVPAAAFLRAGSEQRRVGPPQPSLQPAGQDEMDVLEAWALADVGLPQSTIGAIVSSVETAISGAVEAGMLTIVCPNPKLEVPFAASDLEILLVNMLLTCRDSVGANAIIGARLEEISPAESASSRQPSAAPEGRYLLVDVTARGEAEQVPVIAAFSTCESLAKALGGQLGASTGRGRVNLQAQIPIQANSGSGARVTHVRVAVIVQADATIRQAIGEKLDELGVIWYEMNVDEELDMSSLEQADVIFADRDAINHFDAIMPFLGARLVEVARRGTESVGREYPVLRVPLDMSELREYVTNA